MISVYRARVEEGIAPQDWTIFYEVVRDASGIDFTEYRQDHLRRRIASLMQKWQIENLNQLAERIRQNRSDLANFIDRMAVNVTELFRDVEKWKELETSILPALRPLGPDLDCWSAGCSSGAEAYTLAMVLHHNFPGHHRIRGTDIDQSALRTAVLGQFGEDDIQGVPAAYAARYLEKDGLVWNLRSDLLGMVQFERADLLAPVRNAAAFDLIICRNVVIYFNEDAKARLFRQFYDALRPGGYLFIGTDETIVDAKRIGFQSTHPNFYRKSDAGEFQWQNAS